MNRDENTSKKYSRFLILLFFLLISLIIHLLVFGIALKYSFKKHAKSVLVSIAEHLAPREKRKFQIKKEAKRRIKLKQENVDTRPAKLVAPRSNFGWVMFDTREAKQPTQLEIPTTKQGDVGKAKLFAATEKKLATPVPAKKPDVGKKATAVSAIEAGKKHAVDEKSEKSSKPRTVVAKAVELKEPALVDEVKQEAVPEKPAPKPEAVISRQVAPALTKEEEKAMILRSVLREGAPGRDNPKSEDRREVATLVWGVQRKDKKDDKNIINLTRGYIEKLQGESGTDLIDRDGDPNKKPNFEELKYLSYESKISWCLQSSWKQNFYGDQRLARYEGKAMIEFTLDEKGYLKDLKLLQSTGINDLDKAILKSVEFASPFPPLPKHFATKHYTVFRNINVYTPRFGM